MQTLIKQLAVADDATFANIRTITRRLEREGRPSTLMWRYTTFSKEKAGWPMDFYGVIHPEVTHEPFRRSAAFAGYWRGPGTVEVTDSLRSPVRVENEKRSDLAALVAEEFTHQRAVFHGFHQFRLDAFESQQHEWLNRTEDMAPWDAQMPHWHQTAWFIPALPYFETLGVASNLSIVDDVLARMVPRGQSNDESLPGKDELTPEIRQRFEETGSTGRYVPAHELKFGSVLRTNEGPQVVLSVTDLVENERGSFLRVEVIDVQTGLKRPGIYERTWNVSLTD